LPCKRYILKILLVLNFKLVEKEKEIN